MTGAEFRDSRQEQLAILYNQCYNTHMYVFGSVSSLDPTNFCNLQVGLETPGEVVYSSKIVGLALDKGSGLFVDGERKFRFNPASLQQLQQEIAGIVLPLEVNVGDLLVGPKAELPNFLSDETSTVWQKIVSSTVTPVLGSRSNTLARKSFRPDIVGAAAVLEDAHQRLRFACGNVYSRTKVQASMRGLMRSAKIPDRDRNGAEIIKVWKGATSDGDTVTSVLARYATLGLTR